MSQEVLARGVRRLVEGVTYTIERKLPAQGTIFAKLGDEVKPETVIGESKVSAGFRIFKLHELLGVSPKKAKNYLRRTIGARVYQGDVIAEAQKSFGLRSVQFISPIDGVLQHFNEETGQLTMQYAPVTFRLPIPPDSWLPSKNAHSFMYVKLLLPLSQLDSTLFIMFSQSNRPRATI